MQFYRDNSSLSKFSFTVQNTKCFYWKNKILSIKIVDKEMMSLEVQ